MFSKLRRWLTRLRKHQPAAGRLTMRQVRGQAGERLACGLLRRHQYIIEATNVRFPVGELDVVAQDGATLCFVEVRSQTTGRFGVAAESVTVTKQQRLSRAAQWYLKRRRPAWEGPVRFDVVAIDTQAGKPFPKLIQNAFGLNW